MYPPNWPRCPHCGEPCRDGKATCGDVACGAATPPLVNETQWVEQSARTLDDITHDRQHPDDDRGGDGPT